MTAQIHIVDDDVDISDGIRDILRPLDIRCVRYQSGEDFLRLWRGELEGCVLLDMRLLGCTGLEVIKEMQEATRVLPVIMLTSLIEIQLAVAAMKAGAFDFISKPFAADALISKVKDALAHNEKMLAAQRQHVEVISALSQLTSREREIVDLIVEGRTSKSIAIALGISSYTVDNHRARILDKMRAVTTGQLVQMVVTATVSSATVSSATK